MKRKFLKKLSDFMRQYNKKEIRNLIEKTGLDINKKKLI